MYKVKGPKLEEPVNKPLRVEDLEQGDVAVIVEAGEDFGQYVLVVADHDGQWVVCLNDATVSRGPGDRICKLIERPDAIRLVVKKKAAEAEEGEL